MWEWNLSQSSITLWQLECFWLCSVISVCHWKKAYYDEKIQFLKWSHISTCMIVPILWKKNHWYAIIFLQKQLFCDTRDNAPHRHIHSHTAYVFSLDMFTTSLILATGRRWWRATQTSHSMTTSGTMWWCPGTPTTYIRSRSTHAPLLSTPMEHATWISKVKAHCSVLDYSRKHYHWQEITIAVSSFICTLCAVGRWPWTHANSNPSKLDPLSKPQWLLKIGPLHIHRFS